MKRPLAVLIAAAVLVGCRSSQPATNPFMRTTVAPPATGQTVITPGEPYYPGTTPPMATTPVTPGAPVVVTPATPAGPPMVAPPPVAPPMVIPPTNNKYSPPGGSYQYNQSSNQRPKAAPGEADDPPEATGLAADSTRKPRRDPRAVAVGNSMPDDSADEPDAIRQAIALSEEPTPLIATSYRQSLAWTTGASADDESEGEPADADEDAPKDPENSVRMLGADAESRAELGAAEQATQPSAGGNPAMPVMAGASRTAAVYAPRFRAPRRVAANDVSESAFAAVDKKLNRAQPLDDGSASIDPPETVTH